ncbi:MAG: family 1 encapsulin nanocompartment shell protein [Gudongella sp.]|jgi:uncharacterized linocin/CFP29 family protein|nr:family 1 encapsulin nanocompartment shell protein [Gudongella sp.]
MYRELAPISSEAWEEIDARASEVLKSYLSARRVVKVNGPKGLDYNVITEGRLGSVSEAEDVEFATYNCLPLTEARVEFEMDRWELDNVSRGAKDIDFTPLEEAMERIALFEEKAVYSGLEVAGIEGLEKAASKKPLKFGDEGSKILESITSGVLALRESFSIDSLTLIVGKEAYKKIISKDSGYPLNKRIESLIQGKIVFSHVVDGAFLIPYDNEDLELTIGKDYTIGYQSHTREKVRFYVSESFTFRVLDPDLIVKYEI